MRKHTLTIRGVPDSVLRVFRETSAANRRSLNGELLTILDRAAAVGPESSEQSRVREPAAPPYVAHRDMGPSRPFADSVDREALARVCRQHHIRWLAVFGSQARGEARPDSDVDVVVEFAPGMTPGLAMETVAEALRSVLGARRVDLVTRRGLSPRLREHILATAVPLYGA